VFYHLYTKTFGQIIRFLYFRAWTKGKKNIPKKGPAIIASNHLAVIDSIVLPIIVWRKIWFIGKKEYFQTDTLKHKFQNWFFTSVSVYPVDRAGGAAAEAALNVGRRALEAGNLFGIYPEGTRSPDGNLYKGRVGVAKLALESRVPVICVAMIGSREAQVPGKAIPKPTRVGGIFTPPVDLTDLYDRFDAATQNEDSKELHYLLREATDRVMTSLHNVSGQTYVDMYATDAKPLVKTGEDVIQHANENGITVKPPVTRS
jgi:1-acyl-sn-glycerol-3-phosphate acyltransferase